MVQRAQEDQQADLKRRSTSCPRLIFNSPERQILREAPLDTNPLRRASGVRRRGQTTALLLDPGALVAVFRAPPAIRLRHFFGTPHLI
jgi:hypothetical protein